MKGMLNDIKTLQQMMIGIRFAEFTWQ